MNYRVKLLVVFLCALTILFIADTARSALDTISRLDVVEAERDHWQRPFDVTGGLDLRPGDVVVDLGCGSGYFTLKLSPSVGQGGRVIAEDIRWLPLSFLWFRTVLKRVHNVSIVHGKPNDPHLPERANAVLIANTYHEFTDSRSILGHVRQSLVPGGKLAVVDRKPASTDVGSSEMSSHEISADRVEEQLRLAHFEIVRRQDDFIGKDPNNESWWLLVARKP